MSSELRPPALDEAGLAAALRANLDAKAAASGVALELDASKLVGSSSPEVETACFWIVEELVANILARTDTELVQIRLERDHERLRVTVEDDGWGTPTNPGVPIWGRGPFVRVRERAQAIGGSVNVTLCEGAGSLVEIVLPDPPIARSVIAPSQQYLAPAALEAAPAGVRFLARLAHSS
jgi:signal transduction histidine kinase